jgi:hypothetical protein
MSPRANAPHGFQSINAPLTTNKMRLVLMVAGDFFPIRCISIMADGPRYLAVIGLEHPFPHQF